jgi:hypothetical protein
MIDSAELFAIRGACARHVKAHDLDVPGDHVIEWIRSEAMRLAGGALASPQDEVAAIFYAFCSNEWRLGKVATRMPGRATIRQMAESRLTLGKEWHRELVDLQDNIAEGTVTWEQAREWFDRRLKSRP